MVPSLFSPIQLGGISLPNRIVVAPMCQYSADAGVASDWHLIHLGSLALGGAGLLMLEATAVEPEGRISLGDLGLYDEACERALARILAGIRRWPRLRRSGFRSPMPGARPRSGVLGKAAGRSTRPKAAGRPAAPRRWLSPPTGRCPRRSIRPGSNG